MALIRPMARKWLHPKMEKTNADRILGQEGVVVESIDNLSASGQVKIDGRWRPVLRETIIPAGTRIRWSELKGSKPLSSEKKPNEKREAAAYVMRERKRYLHGNKNCFDCSHCGHSGHPGPMRPGGPAVQSLRD
ncbi:MAG: NfeD family protein [Evtepia gabavorous]